MSEHSQSNDERARWNERYHAADRRPRSVSSLLRQSVDLLQLDRFDEAPTALDIAGGDGIEACWLAELGFATTLIDVSDVALEQATSRAQRSGVAIRAVQLDLDRSPLGPEVQHDVVHVGHYLNRPMLIELFSECAGLLFVAIATVTNLERYPQPPRRFLLEPDELRGLVATHGPTLEVLRYDEDWRPNERHEAWLVAAPAR